MLTQDESSNSLKYQYLNMDQNNTLDQYGILKLAYDKNESKHCLILYFKVDVTETLHSIRFLVPST